MLPRNVVRAEADWSELRERRLDRKGRDFFSLERCLGLRFVLFPFFFPTEHPDRAASR